jgi:hypothetical protein
MAWITLTEPNGNPVLLSGEQCVRIRLAEGGGAPTAKAIVDLTNGSQAVKETPDEILAKLDGGPAQALGLAGPIEPVRSIAPKKKAMRRAK